MLSALPEEAVIPEPMSGCWLWIGSWNAYGYGIIRRQQAHRIAYEAVRGPIPAGLVIDHLCRTRSCVNPAHMEIVTRGENVRRGMNPRAVAARTNTCFKGHPLIPGNLYYHRFRYCRTCAMDRAQRYREAKRTRA